ncbi:unnamed protein product, partial [Meganyctiphanes norvegica]
MYVYDTPLNVTVLYRWRWLYSPRDSVRNPYIRPLGRTTHNNHLRGRNLKKKIKQIIQLRSANFNIPLCFIYILYSTEKKHKFKWKKNSEQTIEETDNGAPIIKKAISTAQNNGHECGIDTMAYAEELAKILYNKELKQIDPLRLKSNATDRIRNELIDQIKKAKRDIDTDKSILKRKEVINNTNQDRVKVDKMDIKNFKGTTERSTRDVVDEAYTTPNGEKITVKNTITGIKVNILELELNRGQIKESKRSKVFNSPKGRPELKYCDGRKFMENLQTEVLEIEFNEFSKGLPTISELDFAKILLRYTYLQSDQYEMYLERLLERIPEERGITFSEFKSFCQFLNTLDDFAIAMRMYTLADQPISQEEFHRAVKICTGAELSAHIVDTVFKIFDDDGDGQLSYKEFIAIMRDRLHRGFKHTSRSEGWDAFKQCVKSEMKAVV